MKGHPATLIETNARTDTARTDTAASVAARNSIGASRLNRAVNAHPAHTHDPVETDAEMTRKHEFGAICRSGNEAADS